MEKKPNIILYGGGDYCTVFLSDDIAKQYDIICIADRNEEMWGKCLAGVPIESPDILKGNKYDLVVITPGKWENIALSLQNDYSVKTHKISLFDAMNKRVVNLVNDEEYIKERREKRSNAVDVIKKGLLLESYRNGDFKGYSMICVVGDKEDYQFVKAHLEPLLKNTIITESCAANKNDDKEKLYVFTGSDYAGRIERLNDSRGVGDGFLIIPLFDVANSILG